MESKRWDRKLCICSAYGDRKELAILAEAWRDDITTWDLVECPKRFQNLDLMLAQELYKTIPADLKRKVRELNATIVEDGSLINGRPIAYLVNQWFKVNENMGLITHISDIQELD